MLIIKDFKNHQWVKMVIIQSVKIVDGVYFKIRAMKKMLSWIKPRYCGQHFIPPFINDSYFLMGHHRNPPTKFIRLKKTKTETDKITKILE